MTYLENIPAYIDGLRVADEQGRRVARSNLIRAGEAALEYMRDALHNEEDIVRWEMVKVLVALSTPSAVPLLITALNDRVDSIAWLAADGLSALEPAAFLQFLSWLADASQPPGLRALAGRLREVHLDGGLTREQLSRSYQIVARSSSAAEINVKLREIFSPGAAKSAPGHSTGPF